jgi:hypothetical protein
MFASLARDVGSAPRRDKARPQSNKRLLLAILGGGGLLLLVCGGLVTFGVYKLTSAGKDTAPQKTEQQAAQGEDKKQPPPEKNKDGPDKKPPEKKTADDNSSPAKALDVSFIYPACNAAFVIQPARIAKSKSSLLPPPEERAKLIEQGIQTIGIDFGKVEQIIVVLEPAPPGPPKKQSAPPRPPPGKGPPGQPPRPGADEPAPFIGAVILRFAEHVDGMEMLTKFLRQTDAVKSSGKTYYRSKTEKQDGEPLAGHFDDRTILLGPESAIQKMLAAKNASSPLRDKLREFGLENDVFGIFLTEPIKPMLKGLAQSPQAKQQFPTAKTLDEDLIAVSLTANLDGDKLVQIVLEGQNDAAAQNLEKLVNAGLDVGKKIYPQFVKPQIEKAAPPDVAAKLVKVTDQIQQKDGITVSREGKNVVVTLHKPKDLDAQ